MVFGSSARILCKAVVVGRSRHLSHSLAASGAHGPSTIELGLGNSRWEQACMIESLLNASSKPHILRHFCSWMLVFMEPLVSLWGYQLLHFFLGLLHFMGLQSWSFHTLVGLNVQFWVWLWSLWGTGTQFYCACSLPCLCDHG